jgi:hypothetical protein
MTASAGRPVTGRPFPPVRPYVEPAPGDPDGDPDAASTRLARELRMEWSPGWEFTRTSAVLGEPFDPTVPPPGDGWELNGYRGDRGHGAATDASGREMQVSYWRRRVAPQR